MRMTSILLLGLACCGGGDDDGEGDGDATDVNGFAGCSGGAGIAIDNPWPGGDQIVRSAAGIPIPASATAMRALSVFFGRRFRRPPRRKVDLAPLLRGLSLAPVKRFPAVLSTVQLTIEVEREDDGRWIADLPALPGVTVYGPSREDAVRACKALALRVIADRLDHGEDIFSGHAEGFDKDVPPGLTFAVAA